MSQHRDESGRRPPVYKDLFLLQLAALVFVTDQFTKFLVRQFLVFRESYPEDGFFRITHTYNTGSAFGLFQDQNLPLILVSLVGITILLLIYRSQRRPSILLRLSLGLQLGGAAGNLLDRLRLDHVTDFVDVGAWPIFNLADASIVTGLVLLAYMFLVTDGLRSTDARKASAPGVPGTGSEANIFHGYNWCPVCDGEMRALPRGWRCYSCGATERIEPHTTTMPEGRNASVRDGIPNTSTNSIKGIPCGSGASMQSDADQDPASNTEEGGPEVSPATSGDGENPARPDSSALAE